MKDQLAELPQYAALHKRMGKVNQFVQQYEAVLSQSIQEKVKSIQAVTSIVNGENTEPRLKWKTARQVYLTVLDLKRSPFMAYMETHMPYEKDYVERVHVSINKCGQEEIFLSHATKAAASLIDLSIKETAKLNKIKLDQARYLQAQSIQDAVSTGLNDPLIKDRLAHVFPKKSVNLETRMAKVSAIVDQFEAGLTQQVILDVKKIQALVPVINDRLQSIKIRNQSARQAYLSIMDMRGDSVLNAHIKTRMPYENDYMERALTVLKSEKWEETFKLAAAIEAKKLVRAIGRADKQCGQDQDERSRYIEAKNIHDVVQSGLSDLLIKDHLVTHLPQKYADLQKKTLKIASIKNQFEAGLSQVVKQEVAELKVALSAINDQNLKRDVRIAKARFAYLSILGLREDLLLKAHLHSNMPKENHYIESFVEKFETKAWTAAFLGDTTRKVESLIKAVAKGHQLLGSKLDEASYPELKAVAHTVKAGLDDFLIKKHFAIQLPQKQAEVHSKMTGIAQAIDQFEAELTEQIKGKIKNIQILQAIIENKGVLSVSVRDFGFENFLHCA